MQKKITITNSSQSWNPKKRYKINEVVSYGGAQYQNATGGNSEPGVGLDWLAIDVLEPATVESLGAVKLTSFDADPKVYPQSEMDSLLDEKLNISDIPSNLSLYPTNVASDISGYSKMVISLDDADYNDTAVDISTDAITTTDQLVASLASAAGILVGNPGIINVVTIGNVKRLSGTGRAEFYFKVFKRTSAGVESLIATSNSTMPISNSVYGEFQATAILNNGTFTATDRVVIKYYANRISGNSNPIYQFQFGGVTPVRTILPVPFSVIPAGYVPNSRTITINDVTFDLSQNVGWNIPTHSPVTIATANGLSLNNQALSLAAASSSQNGALSSTDWNTFNNKESAIAAGTTSQYWRGDKSWQTLNKAAVGLGNVDNTSDVNKPISSAAQTALDGKQNLSEKNQNGGYAGLDSSGKIQSSQLPAIAISDTFVVGSQSAMLALSVEIGDVAVRTDLNKTFILKGSDPTQISNWQELLSPTDSVSSVFGRNGAVVANSGDYNTSQVTENTNLYYTEARVNANANVTANTAARHAAVTLGTANGLSLSGQQLSLGLSSGSANGALSSTDWNTFNNKQDALTNPITGSGTIDRLPKFTGSTTLGNSQIFDNGTNVGIGTSSPISRLEVSGTFRNILISGAGGQTLISSINGVSNGYLINVDTSNNITHTWHTGTNTPSLFIAANSNVGIGTTTDAGFKLDVNGTGRFSGNVTATGFFQSSDIRLKDIISRYGDVIKYKWKDKRDDKIHIGYVAQEVLEVMPDAVSEDSEGMLSVNYIEVLVAKIAKLENRIKQLEK